MLRKKSNVGATLKGKKKVKTEPKWSEDDWIKFNQIAQIILPISEQPLCAVEV